MLIKLIFSLLLCVQCALFAQTTNWVQGLKEVSSSEQANLFMTQLQQFNPQSSTDKAALDASFT